MLDSNREILIAAPSLAEISDKLARSMHFRGGAELRSWPSTIEPPSSWDVDFQTASLRRRRCAFRKRSSWGDGWTHSKCNVRKSDVEKARYLIDNPPKPVKGK
jgi:hypothetical protein